jgi:hypothetical protein
MIMAGDQGMITGTRIDDLRKLEGMEWITALKAPAIARLAADDGPLQMSLFDTQNFAEISHPRLSRRAADLLPQPGAGRREGAQARQPARRHRRRPGHDPEVRHGREADRPGQDRDQGRQGDRQAQGRQALHHRHRPRAVRLPPGRGEDRRRGRPGRDLREIRTSVDGGILDAAGVVTAYKDLKYVERDFRITKADDLDLRPIHHYLADRVRGHVLICMLACYLTWHLRAALAELTFTDQDIPPASDPVAPARCSAQARAKDTTKHNSHRLPVRSYQDLLGHLATLTRQTISFAGQKIEKLTTPTPVQARAFELLGTPVPLALR